MKTLAGELPFAQAVLSENLSIACSNCFAIKEDKKKDPTGYMDYEAIPENYPIDIVLFSFQNCRNVVNVVIFITVAKSAREMIGNTIR